MITFEEMTKQRGRAGAERRGEVTRRPMRGIHGREGLFQFVCTDRLYISVSIPHLWGQGCSSLPGTARATSSWETLFFF